MLDDNKPGPIAIFGRMNKYELSYESLKDFLDVKVELYNRPAFIEHDPISIPHLYTHKGDIEIAGFLTATIAWGNRKMILRNAARMIELLDNSPYDFVLNSSEMEIERLKGFVHRTFNSLDLIYFLEALKHIYKSCGGLENIFYKYQTDNSLQPAIHKLHTLFFELPHSRRTEKHLSDPEKGSAAKKINMFLRWMIRKDDRGVDFGIWNSISPSKLSCPLDVHSGNTARELGILTRKQNDAKAVVELDSILREFDKEDPVKYDFALFGLGVKEDF
jgi:uncharacterized protein (TIGR02757 family)